MLAYQEGTKSLNLSMFNPLEPQTQTDQPELAPRGRTHQENSIPPVFPSKIYSRYCFPFCPETNPASFAADDLVS